MIVLLLFFISLNFAVFANIAVPARRSNSFPVRCPVSGYSCMSYFSGCIEMNGQQMCIWCSARPSSPCMMRTHFALPTPPPTPRPTFMETPAPTADPTRPSDYKLDVIFKPEVPQWLQTVARNAALRWQEIITQDFAETLIVPNNHCPGVSAGTQVDDSLVSIGYQYIDGASGSNSLAYAGTCFYSRGKSRVGAIVLDSSNFPSSGSAVLAYNVILHEMGHILGIQETAWRNANLVNSALRYTGTNANAQLPLIGANHNQAYVEDLYGQGSRGSHFKESVYDSELMTSLAEYKEMPISRLTLGALADLGYSVDYSKADPYTVPTQSGRRLRKKKGVPFHGSVGELPFGSEEVTENDLKEKI